MNAAQESFYEADTLDDLLHSVLSKLISITDKIQASRGPFTEIFGAVLVLNNPRARLSRSESKGKIFSALGELCWYLSKTNDLAFMEHYLPSIYKDESDDGKTVRSGYGERLFNHHGNNQLENVITLLRARPTSRRAVIQLFDASDLSQHFRSIPCTCTLQFVVRDNKLNLFVNMRSNDAFWGLPHDVFTFTMLQEIVARSIDIEPGIYKHCAGSLHLYDEHVVKAQAYLSEGWQSPIPMDPMPNNPWDSLADLSKVEEAARKNQEINFSNFNQLDYWLDLFRILVFFQKVKFAGKESVVACEAIKSQMASQIYNSFLDTKLEELRNRYASQ